MATVIRRLRGGIWTEHLITLAVATFLLNFGSGLLNGASTNFFVVTLGMTGQQVLWLAGLREVPGLTLIFVAALIMHWPLRRRAFISVLLMAIGYGLYVVINSFVALVAVAIVASLGFHTWQPYQSAIAMSLTTKDRSGEVMGAISSVRSLASIAGMAVIAAISALLPDMNLRNYFASGALLILIAAIWLLRLPRSVGVDEREMPRMLVHPRYWLYYVLTFFEGSRMQVFGTFGTLVLVRDYGLGVTKISLVLLASAIVNLVASPYLGKLLDRLGERLTLSVSYVLLAFCFVGYATFHNTIALAALLVCINMLVLMSMGLQTYVNRIAPARELTPTLSAGVSINHITSVGMSLVAGLLLERLGYEALCYGAAALIMLSVPFALAIRLPKMVPQPAAVTAE
ncbi:MAG: MFS transporter [Chloroflexi bacterium]|jgi:predicted MFS family arabinose efflux permease|nr:MFS transporter [Chloroflexota bacterium]